MRSELGPEDPKSAGNDCADVKYADYIHFEKRRKNRVSPIRYWSWFSDSRMVADVGTYVAGGHAAQHS